MSQLLRPLFGLTLSMLLLTVVAYPLAVTGLVQVVFERQADGSFLLRDGQAVGSSLVGQPFSSGEYFQGRPSAAGDGYDAASSSGSNLGPTSRELADRLAADGAAYRTGNDLPSDSRVPADAITASGSGLDPHISPANARLQATRVATTRGIPAKVVLELIGEHTDGRILGIIGEPRVNVLKLNLSLDERYPMKP
jgi:K+-transporting ATPase ATPase C chain